MFPLIVAGITVGVFALTFLLLSSQPRLPTSLLELKHELIYQYVGTVALIMDYVYRTRNHIALSHTRSGDVAVITGGNRGIGLHVIRMLLECGFTVIIGVRNEKTTEQSIKKLRDEGTTSGKTVIMQLDVSSLESIKAFAAKVKQQYKELHLLLNNAGVMNTPRSNTVDGFEHQLATNYLGHFYLTHLLLPLLIAGGEKSAVNSRVVNVSSSAHKTGIMDFSDLESKKSYISSVAYGTSKLAQVMFSKTLNDILQKDGHRVQINSVHPGVVNTELFEHTAIQRFVPWLPKLLFKSPEQGATSIVYAAISEEIEGKGGAYLSNCGPACTSALGADKEKGKKLFDVSCQMVKITKFGDK